MARRFKTMMRAAIAVLAFAGAQAAPAQMFMNTPDFKPGPIDGSDPLIGFALPGATPAEYRAHLLWTMRAGLNVAALQCQFSPFLRSVDNYNGVLAHHAKEFADAYSTLNAYFKRVHGAKEGQRKFDDYSTITYNGFSTLQAQYGFCNVASNISKEALTRPKGDLHLTAEARMRELRNSLVPAFDSVTGYNPGAIPMPQVPPLSDDCYDRRGNLRSKCQANFSQVGR